MDDNDALVLKQLADAVTEVDLEYRRADINGKLALKDKRDKAFEAYSSARLKLLADGVICTDDDVAEMAAIKQEIEKAADTQAIIIAAVRLIAFAARIA